MSSNERTFDVVIHYEAIEGYYGGIAHYMPEADVVTVTATTKREAKIKALPELRTMPYFRHHHDHDCSPFAAMTVYEQEASDDR